MSKCKKCGYDDTPLWEYSKGKKKPVWKNWFKMDLMSALYFFSILLIVIGYTHDMQKCEDAIEHPCEFCNTTGCCIIQTPALRRNTPIVQEEVQELLRENG